MQAVKEFDYHLWTTEENGIKKYWAKVKATGEVTEVDVSVMRLLRREEKKLRRALEGQEAAGVVLSLDCVSDEEVAEYWLVDSYRLSDEVSAGMLEQELIKVLTPFQKEVFACCMKEGVKYAEFARQHQLDKSTVYEARDAIRNKFKKIYP